MNIDAVIEAYRGAEGRWTRCDWHTEFGEEKVDLNGLSSVQANIMAEATAGTESERWRRAAVWLRGIERSAQQAEMEARTAYELATAGHLGAALSHARQAYELESAHHARAIWAPLVAAIERMMDEDGFVLECPGRPANRKEDVVFMPWTL